MRLAVLAGSAALVALSSTMSPLAAPLAAQPGGVGPACSIDQNTPKELAIAYLNYTRAKSAAEPGARKGALRMVMKDLGEKTERYGKNLAGYNFVLAQALTLWLVEPGIQPVTSRGSLGFTSDTASAYDLIAHLDTAFTVTATAAPNCATEVAQSRQSDAWLALTKRALDASSSGQPDTAVLYANRALQLSRENPYPYHVLATVSNAKGDNAGAIANWKKVIDASGTDSTYKDLRLSSYFYLGVKEMDLALAKTGDAQKVQAKAAAGWFRMFLKEAPTSPDGPNMMNGLADALRMAGDSAEIPVMYLPLVAAPDKYSDFALTMAGVIATRANDTESALKLFEGAVKVNPLSRDALRNVAATYYARNSFDKMWAPLNSLVSIDPNNVDAWLMYAFAAQGLSKAAKTPAEKKAWTDTLIKYNSKAEALPVKIDITSYQRTADGTSVSVSVEQVAEKPGQYTLVMEFLDAKGAVVTTDSKPVGPVAKGERKSVNFKSSGAGVVAFRYKPLG